MDYALRITLIIFCLLMSAYFSATETAFSTLNKIRIKNLAEDGNKKAKLVYKLTEKYDTMLSAVLIGNNIVNILSSSIATLVFLGIMVNSPDLATTVSTVVMTLVVLIFGEISPKTSTTTVITAVAIVAPYFGYSCMKNTVARDDIAMFTILFPTRMLDSSMS